jgi:recombinational DNA repair protein (RecF pathway)
MNRSETWTPPVNNCSRCGSPLPSSPLGWQWLEFDYEGGELVCPDCLNAKEKGAVFDRLEELREGDAR